MHRFLIRLLIGQNLLCTLVAFTVARQAQVISKMNMMYGFFPFSYLGVPLLRLFANRILEKFNS